MSKSRIMEDMSIVSGIEARGPQSQKLFERLGGRSVIERVHKIFYNKIYAHPWLGLFFKEIDQIHIESQQTEFMMMLFGGPKIYGGRMPIDAHEHIMISEELFTQRRELLRESLQEAGILEGEANEWLNIDGAFKKVLIKNSLDECQKRFHTDEIKDFQDPRILK